RVESPSLEGNGQPKLVLFVAFSPQGQESEALIESELQEGSGDGGERRRLVVPPVEPVEGPPQVRDPDRPPDTGARRVLVDRSREVREPHPCRQREPLRSPVLVFE